MKPVQYVFTRHARQRFVERALNLSPKTDFKAHEEKNRSWLNLEMKKRIQGAVVIKDTEMPGLKENLTKNYGQKDFTIYLNGKMVFIAVPADTPERLPVFLTCYRRDHRFDEAVSKHYGSGKVAW